jgi:hypothetical protein
MHTRFGGRLGRRRRGCEEQQLDPQFVPSNGGIWMVEEMHTWFGGRLGFGRRLRNCATVSFQNIMG